MIIFSGKQKRLLKLSFLLIFSAFNSVQAADIFAYMAMPEAPLPVSAPSFTDMETKLSFGFEVNEEYKKWLDDVKVCDFSGHSYIGSFQYQINSELTIGTRFVHGCDQKWKNTEDKEMSIFSFDSKAGTDEFFIKTDNKYFSACIGKGRSKDEFEGSYDIHEDIINALGANPTIYFDTDTDYTFWKIYKNHKRLKLLAGGEKSTIDHRIYAETPAMKLTLNLDRDVSEKHIEAAYELNRQWAPYFRHYKYKDRGAGINYRNDRYEIGNNSTYFKSDINTFGISCARKNAGYYLDYSKISFKASGHTFFNLGNIDPLFIFSTIPVAVTYDLNYSPDSAKMFRFGMKRHYRRINYNFQYSLARLEGNTVRDTLKKHSPLFSIADIREQEIKKRTTKLHRLDLTLKAPVSKGQWIIDLNLLVPVTKSKKNWGAGGYGGGGAGGGNQNKDLRGGWQLAVSREVNF